MRPQHVERKMGPDVGPGEAHERYGHEREETSSSAQVGKGGHTEGDGDAGMPGHIPEPRRLPAPVLRTAGLVRGRKKGRSICYRLAEAFPHEMLEHCLRDLLAISPEAGIESVR